MRFVRKVSMMFYTMYDQRRFKAAEENESGLGYGRAINIFFGP